MIALDPLGDRAFLARFDSEDEARGWAEAARAAALDGVTDVVLAYRSVGLHVDPDFGDLDRLARDLRTIAPVSSSEECGRLISLPVLYDGEDLAEVASRLGIGVGDVVNLHANRDYRVLAVGFLPGFPYAGDLAPELRGLARRDHPRPRVPAGSVAIAGRQTGVYPAESPGGWHLIGRTPLRIVDAERGHFPIRAGDRLRFVPVPDDEYRAREGEALA